MSDDRQLEGRIKAIMARVFEVGPEAITDKTRRRDFERWDSLGHLALIGAVQDEFQIEIPPDQALEMETIEDVKRAILSARGTSARS